MLLFQEVGEVDNKELKKNEILNFISNTTIDDIYDLILEEMNSIQKVRNLDG